jgi:hypothetical protein
MYTTIGTYYIYMYVCIYIYIYIYKTYLLFVLGVCYLGWIPTRTTDSHLKRIIITNCCIHTVVPHDDGPRYAETCRV